MFRVINVKADPFSRNRAADTVQPDSQFDIKIYPVVDNHPFLEQLRMEQNSDPVISKAKQIVLQGGVIEKGRLKRVQKQLHIENDLLTKSGRPILPLHYGNSLFTNLIVLPISDQIKFVLN